MSQLTRRGMFSAVATVTAGVALPAIAKASTVPSEDPIIARARAAAITPLPHPDAITARARVALCRAWDHQIYLIVDDETHGFATVDPRAFAIAVAAQLIDRPIALQYWGHRTSGDGTGAFDGVVIAADTRDLPHT